MTSAAGPGAGADSGASKSPIAVDIRLAAEADLPAILRLQAACFPRPLPERHLRHELMSNRLAEFYVAQEMMPGGGHALATPAERAAILAYVSVWWMFDEAHVSAIAVDPSWRRRGLARQLMLFLRARARQRGMAALTLEVREGNQAARRLYAGLGMLPVGRRKAYYADTGEDALIFTEDLRSGAELGES